MRTHVPLLEAGIIGVLAVMIFVVAGATFRPATASNAVAIRNITPADGARVPARPMRITADVQGDRNLQRVSLRVNDREVEPTIDERDPRNWRVTYEVRDPEATQRIVLVARDQHGRQRTQNWSVQVDPAMSAPQFLSVQPPNSGFAPAGEVRVAAVVQTDAAISAVTLRVAGETRAATQEAAGPNRVTISARVKLQPGNYQASLTVEDREGDRSVRAWDFRVPDPQEMMAFAETGKAISGGFRTFWEERGGLAIFGLPITDEMREDNLVVQYFERARFEYHPTADGLLSEVKLGRLGADLRKPDPPRPEHENEPGFYFPETGHGLSGPFREYWEAHGGLDLFGFPITDELRQGAVTVQWFERARFELHTINGRPTVLLGHIGREAYENRYGKETPRP